MTASRRITLLLSALTVCGLQQLSAQVTAVPLGFGVPPATLGGYTMTAFDPGSIAGQSYSAVESSGIGVPPSGPDTWGTWGQNYSGNVYVGLGQTTLTLTLHGAVEAVDFYAEPNQTLAAQGPPLFFSMTATDSSGASVTELIFGSHGSGGVGFYEDVAGGPYLTSIKVTETDPTGFAVGEFGINGATPGLSGQFGTVPDTTGTLVIMVFALGGVLAYSRRAVSLNAFRTSPCPARRPLSREGPPRIARRFNAGFFGRTTPSPEGTADRRREEPALRTRRVQPSLRHGRNTKPTYPSVATLAYCRSVPPGRKRLEFPKGIAVTLDI